MTLVRKIVVDPVRQAAERLHGRLRDAYLEAVAALQASVGLQDLADALGRGDYEAAVRILGVDSNFARVLEGSGVESSFRGAVQEAYRAGAIAAHRALPEDISLQLSFDLLNPRAIDFIRSYSFGLIHDISHDARESIRSVLLRAFQEGGHPFQQARQIRNSIGLTTRQDRAVANYRNALQNNSMAALGRQLRDGRFDRSVSGAIDLGAPLPQPRIDKLVDRYRERYVKYRAETIARTETIRAANHGQREVWRQAREQDLIQPQTTERVWIASGDADTCPDCAALDGTTVDLDDEFDEGDPPIHPNCRCTTALQFDTQKRDRVVIKGSLRHGHWQVAGRVWLWKYSEDEARDEHGRWTSGGDNPEEQKRFATEKLIKEGQREGTSRVRVVNAPHIGIWGGSHFGSRVITGYSAKQMGIDGYKDYDPTKESRALGDKLLSVIAEGRGAGEPLYHGFRNTQNIEWEPGSTVRLPLTATSGDIQHSMMYGLDYGRQDNSGATVFEFPPNTAIAGYSRWDRENTKDFGYTWSEAIVAGEFKVKGTRTEHEGGYQSLPVTVVALEPVSLFDPATGKWVKKSATDLSELVGRCDNHQVPAHPSSAEESVEKYSPDEARDERGRWTEGGGGGAPAGQTGVAALLGGPFRKPKGSLDQKGPKLSGSTPVDQYRALTQANITLGRQVDEKQVEDRFGMDVVTLKNTLLAGVPHSEGTHMRVTYPREYAGDRDVVKLGFVGPPTEKGSAWNAVRIFKFKQGIVDHHFFEIDPAFQHSGIAKQFLANSADLYDHLGLKTIETVANIDRGAYAWVKYGFVPSQESWDEHRREWLYQSNPAIAPPGRSLGEAAREALKGADPRGIRIVAADPDGKAFLSGQSWEGDLKLDDRESYGIFRAYVGR